VSGHKRFTSSLATAAAVAALGLAHLASADTLGQMATRAMSAVPHAPQHRAPTLALMSAAPQILQKHQPLDQPRHALDLRAPDPRSIAGMEGGGGDYRASFPIRWQKYSELVNPEVERMARNFRREGLPLVRLWQSGSGEHLVAVGLNPHGVPGIWLTQKVPD
jgi:hypothetical protein